MGRKSSFLMALDRVEQIENTTRGQVAAIRGFWREQQRKLAYEEAMRLEEATEKMVLMARVLPAYTGCPFAEMEVQNTIALSIPVEIGFTRENWFGLRIPALLPKKAAGSASYIRSFLYPAMRQFFEKQPPVRYQNCVLVYRHVYDRERPERRKRDHDNIEVNMVSDIVAMYVMPDDGPQICSHYYCSAAGALERTEVYVVPKEEFPAWLEKADKMPDEGVKLYEKQRIPGKKYM